MWTLILIPAVPTLFGSSGNKGVSEKKMHMLPTRGPEIHFQTPETVRENCEK
jgi:hypothetical protein